MTASFALVNVILTSNNILLNLLPRRTFCVCIYIYILIITYSVCLLGLVNPTRRKKTIPHDWSSLQLSLQLLIYEEHYLSMKNDIKWMSCP